MSEPKSIVLCCEWDALLGGIEDDSVDMLLTDMPYNTAACAWDDYIVPLDEFWRHVKRIMKQQGVVALTAVQPFASKLVMSNPGKFRYEWIWHKPMATGFLNANRAPLKAHENVLIFYDKSAMYNPQMSKGTPYFTSDSSDKITGSIRDKNLTRTGKQNYGGERFPRTVLEFSNATNTVHPTQKPVALFEYFIRTYTSPGDLVVDPFVGSGTAAIAAANTGRYYIVGDISQDYIDITNGRLSVEFGHGVKSESKTLEGLPLFSQGGASA